MLFTRLALVRSVGNLRLTFPETRDQEHGITKFVFSQAAERSIGDDCLRKETTTHV